MPTRLQDELKQTRPFASPEAEAAVNVARTAAVLARGFAELLKPHGLSLPQYNVLRILRGAGAGGLRCGEIGERMIDPDPDVTRLLDRLERAGLVARARSAEDRRVVRARLTAAGRALVDRLDRPMLALHAQQLGHLGRSRLQALSRLLEAAREGVR